ncbi:MAG: hypothetical protein IJK94_05535, partial [Bacteroidaceae bacterium]|nr:hypothetical protein [Bacteroidaceae bacterium]
MRKIVLILILMIFSSCLYAGQPKKGTFLGSNIAWIDGLGYASDGEYQTSEILLCYYTTAGDTLINGKSYYRIRATRVCRPVINMGWDEQGNEFVCDKWLNVKDINFSFFMREDECGDVWLYVDDESVFGKLSEHTFYDDLADKLVNRDLFLFNNKKTYAVGDKQPFGLIAWENPDPGPNWWEGDMWYIDSLEVMAVNDEVMQDGKSYKTCTYRRYSNGEIAKSVQGIGPLWSGPLGGLGGPNTTYQKNYFAFYKNDQLIYKNEGYVSALEKYFPDILDVLRGKKIPVSYAYHPFVVEGKVWNIEKVSTWVGWPDYGVVRTEK